MSITHQPFNTLLDILDPTRGTTRFLTNLLASPTVPLFTALIFLLPTCTCSSSHSGAPLINVSRSAVTIRTNSPRSALPAHPHHPPPRLPRPPALPLTHRPRAYPAHDIRLPPAHAPRAAHGPLPLARDPHGHQDGSSGALLGVARG